ncbi:MAG: 7-cyano-7-deazaguanine synthase QueC [Armatimonadetes bacterium]|nr:7-cyano-7-deazaguanine synthase QueC [Armatimonadota bacterium]
MSASFSPRAVCLVSGGLDSATSTAIARKCGFDVYALSFDYGQRHRKELEAAERVAAALGAKRHVVITFNLRQWGGSALTTDMDVPMDRSSEQMPGDIPITYVPARNTIFLSFALGWAETVQAQHIFLGVNQLDYSGYPDCRAEFLRAFETTANLGTKAGTEGQHFHIEAPLIQMTKAEIIRAGVELGVDYALTWSCYLGEDRPCMHCDSCILRAKGFAEAGIRDPLLG